MTSPAHLPNTVLDGYLHHTLPPSNHQQVRAHHCCQPCWQAWNRHRWDAARSSPLYTQLAEFLGAAFRPHFDSSRALAAEWDVANPHTDHDIAQFFRTSTSYLYNLAIWEVSGNRPDYFTHALPILARHGTRTTVAASAATHFPYAAADSTSSAVTSTHPPQHSCARAVGAPSP
jgi:hypothetical protein